MPDAWFRANPPAWSEWTKSEFPIRLAIWVSREPASCRFTVFEIARDITAVAKLMGLAAGPNDEATIRLAAQLARETASVAYAGHEIQADAVAIVANARAARRALKAGRDPSAYVATAQELADHYFARVVDNRDLAGMVLGIRFPSGRFNSGMRNIFYVA